jgi:hypothetical protein
MVDADATCIRTKGVSVKAMAVQRLAVSLLKIFDSSSSRNLDR